MSDTEKPNKTEPTKPDDRLKLTVNGKEQEIFMSAGLVRRLALIMGQTQDIGDIYTNTVVQNVLMIEALRPRDEHGKISDKEYNLDDFELSMGDGKTLMTWVAGHVLCFFIEQSNEVNSLKDNPGAPIVQLAQLMTGMLDSAKVKQSAGASVAS